MYNTLVFCSILFSVILVYMHGTLIYQCSLENLKSLIWWGTLDTLIFIKNSLILLENVDTMFFIKSSFIFNWRTSTLQLLYKCFEYFIWRMSTLRFLYKVHYFGKCVFLMECYLLEIGLTI